MSDRDELERYFRDLAKAKVESERIRKGGPLNVQWLIVQMLHAVLNGIARIEEALRKAPGGGPPPDLGPIIQRLDALTALERDHAELSVSTAEGVALLVQELRGKPGARIVVRGPVSDR